MSQTHPSAVRWSPTPLLHRARGPVKHGMHARRFRQPGTQQFRGVPIHASGRTSKESAIDRDIRHRVVPAQAGFGTSRRGYTTQPRARTRRRTHVSKALMRPTVIATLNTTASQPLMPFAAHASSTRLCSVE